MDGHSHLIFLFFAAIPVLGVGAQWLAWRLRLPSILLLLVFGVLLRFCVKRLAPHVDFDQLLPDSLLFPIVSLAVAVVLFEGGLTLRLRELENGGAIVLRLVTIGAAMTWVLTAFAASFILGLELRTAALVGAILVVTGPTVVAPLLRHIRPRGRIGSIVKWEGIVIDPIGAVLAVLVFETAFPRPDETAWDMILIPLKTIVIGGVVGWAAAESLTQLVKRYWIPDYLHGVAFLAVAIAAFAISNVLQEESGLVTVTLMGIALANQKHISIRHVVEFKEHLGVFLIACLFIVLGSRLELRSVGALGWSGALFLAIMIVCVRPISVLAASWKTDLKMPERLFLACLAPRGIVAAAVSSVFALRLATLAENNPEDPSLANLAAYADRIVPITFLVIIGTVAVYGLLAAPLARRLKLADPNPQGILFAGADGWVRELASALQKVGCQVMLVDTNYAHVSAARMAHLPADCASILSEHVREELDLGGIGRLLAVTANDEVNSLAVGEFLHVFGRANVYQLPPEEKSESKRKSTPPTRGRPLFGAKCAYQDLADRIARGSQMKTTPLTDEFGYEEFREMYGDSTIVLFTIDANKRVQIATAEEPLTPEAGQTIIALTPTP